MSWPVLFRYMNATNKFSVNYIVINPNFILPIFLPPFRATAAIDFEMSPLPPVPSEPPYENESQFGLQGRSPTGSSGYMPMNRGADSFTPEDVLLDSKEAIV